MRNLPGLLLSVALCVTPAANGVAHDSCKRLECEKTRQKIAKIEARMRLGYKTAAGERMKDELRRLRRYRAKVCR